MPLHDKIQKRREEKREREILVASVAKASNLAGKQSHWLRRIEDGEELPKECDLRSISDCKPH